MFPGERKIIGCEKRGFPILGLLSRSRFFWLIYPINTNQFMAFFDVDCKTILKKKPTVLQSIFDVVTKYKL